MKWRLINLVCVCLILLIAGLAIADVTFTVRGRTVTIAAINKADSAVTYVTPTGLTAKAATAVTISAGTGLTGGGDLSASRTLSADSTSWLSTDYNVSLKQNAGTQIPYRANSLTLLSGNGYWTPAVFGIFTATQLPRAYANNTVAWNSNAYTKTGNTDGTDATGPAITLTSGTTAGNTAALIAAGYGYAYGVTQMNWEPIYETRFATVSAFRGGAYTIGLTSATFINASAPNVHAAYIRYDSTADNTAFWRTVTIAGTGSSAQVTVTSVAVATSTEYDLIIYTNATDDTIFFVMGVGGAVPTLIASHATVVPGATQRLNEEIGCRSLVTGTAAAIKWRGTWIAWAQ